MEWTREHPDPRGPTDPSDADERFMARALDLAEQGRGTTSPNPLVGCVLVSDGAIVGEGYHRRAGEDHAEIVALREAGDAAKGATAYVTLEPCDHHGRTPPCSLALIDAGVRRVVVATLDPNPLVDGSGVRRLRDAGVAVDVGVRGDEAERQNEVFRTSQLLSRPFVLYKTAMTLDGKIATRTGHSRWITGEASRERVQRWRHELDAVAVGVSTVLLDDPRLTARVEHGRTPRKVVFDSLARTPTGAALLAPDAGGAPARVTVFVGPSAPGDRIAALRDVGAEVVTLDGPKGRPSVRGALGELHRREVRSVLLEGGGTLAWSFLEARAIDRVAWFIGPKLLGGNGATPLGGMGVTTMDEAFELDDLRSETSGTDLLLTGRVRYPAAPVAGAVDDNAASEDAASTVAVQEGRI
ncbi:MAG: bifunctional diaminohydroxyphosphoribosylaminopyrimidine deaminase/5-amino-6-(5-phosphoribosylamino)uracil reductase RibD [Trueperaceae bacterium]|nr:bifunctional diaminohydroxyphosphoribosylaminopyrimidine deaminase/5-amino-6-(5-phosphoribosylamino)uracil reductase RibD [Trueperaceae bacterium]